VTGYPLLIEARDVKVSEVEFNPDFISRILPKVDWDCLCSAAQQLGHAEDLPR
jgi:multifunctional methyltransferase subunit TRM112